MRRRARQRRGVAGHHGGELTVLAVGDPSRRNPVLVRLPDDQPAGRKRVHVRVHRRVQLFQQRPAEAAVLLQPVAGHPRPAVIGRRVPPEANLRLVRRRHPHARRRAGRDGRNRLRNRAQRAFANRVHRRHARAVRKSARDVAHDEVRHARCPVPIVDRDEAVRPPAVHVQNVALQRSAAVDQLLRRQRRVRLVRNQRRRRRLVGAFVGRSHHHPRVVIEGPPRRPPSFWLPDRRPLPNEEIVAAVHDPQVFRGCKRWRADQTAHDLAVRAQALGILGRDAELVDPGFHQARDLHRLLVVVAHRRLNRRPLQKIIHLVGVLHLVVQHRLPARVQRPHPRKLHGRRQRASAGHRRPHLEIQRRAGRPRDDRGNDFGGQRKQPERLRILDKPVALHGRPRDHVRAVGPPRDQVLRDELQLLGAFVAVVHLLVRALPPVILPQLVADNRGVHGRVEREGIPLVLNRVFVLRDRQHPRLQVFHPLGPSRNGNLQRHGRPRVRAEAVLRPDRKRGPRIALQPHDLHLEHGGVYFRLDLPVLQDLVPLDRAPPVVFWRLPAELDFPTSIILLIAARNGNQRRLQQHPGKTDR
mmetsp:Transcript_21786/g.54910  ORF Transcript_21786/g.54910 Transcript_21786/m.54910 type:complete len:586 (-) Transcript_21786:691-2448(-)